MLYVVNDERLGAGRFELRKRVDAREYGREERDRFGMRKIGTERNHQICDNGDLRMGAPARTQARAVHAAAALGGCARDAADRYLSGQRRSVFLTRYEYLHRGESGDHEQREGDEAPGHRLQVTDENQRPKGK